jgi:6,7-dimethyl-8-ribityllumazine synthase
MEILEILENPGVAVRVCGIYNKLLVVVKFFGDYISDRSIKLYEKPERLAIVKSRWNTKIPIKLDDTRVAEYTKRANEYLNHISITLSTVK